MGKFTRVCATFPEKTVTSANVVFLSAEAPDLHALGVRAVPLRTNGILYCNLPLKGNFQGGVTIDRASRAARRHS